MKNNPRQPIKLKNTILVFLLALPLTSVCQTGLALWSGISVEKKLNKKFSMNVNAQTRFVEDLSYMQTYLGELGISYKVSKKLEISGNYRFINRRKNETKLFINRHRFYGDVSYDQKIGFLKLDYRFRYQHQFKDNDGEIGFDASYLRNKLELAYPNSSKFTPYISGDLFYEFGGTFDQLRPKAGFGYKFNKKHGLDVFIFTNVDLIDHLSPSPIIGLTYKLKL